MVRQIIFPTDFSNAATHAFPAALHLADHFQAEIVTLYAYVQPPIPVGHLSHTMREIVESIELEEFEHFKRRLPELHAMAENLGLGHVTINHALSSGKDIIHRLVATAEKEGGDLIVMGTAGARGIQEFFRGSVASEVMENAPCPVLVIPETAFLSPTIKRIAFATRLDPAERQAQDWVIAFAREMGAEIRWINQPRISVKEFMEFEAVQKQTYPDLPQSFVYCISWSDENDLVRFLQGQDADLLALQVNRTGFFEELFRGNFGKYLARRLSFPILGIPAKS